MEIGSEKYGMFMMKKKKWKIDTAKEIEISNHERIRTLGEKEIYCYLGILVTDTMRLMGMKEKIKKRSSDGWENIFATEIKSKVKYLGSLRRTIYWTFPKIEKTVTQISRPYGPKIDTDAQGLTLKQIIDSKKEEDSTALKITYIHQFKDLKYVQ